MKIGKDIERYDWYYDPELFTEVIIDRLETEQYRNSTRICELLNQQAQRISELEEQLKNAIVPKFKYGQDVWCVYHTNEHRQGFVFELEFVGYTKDKIICCITENEEFEYDEVFETKAEAEAKLQELQGEKK